MESCRCLIIYMTCTWYSSEACIGIVAYLNTQCSQFLYRYQHCLSQSLKKNLSSALLQCHFDYCCSSWYFNLSTKLRRKLQTTQNKIVRFITGLPPRSHIGQLELDKIKYLNVEDRMNQLCLYKYEVKHTLVLFTFDNY